MQLGCAVIAFARKYTKLSIIYPHEIELLTGVSLNQVKSLYQLLEQRYYECFPDQNTSNNNNHSNEKQNMTNIYSTV